MESPQREIQDPSPSISDIPPEVLGEIFLHCLPLKGWGSFSPCDVPWVLTKVCHLWKEVALSTPLLWSRLPFLSEERCCNGDGCLWLLELYLKNSTGAALTLAFEVPPDPEDATFLPLITPHLSRSQHLSISYDRELPGQKIYCVNYKDFPLLKSLELICSYSGVTSRALEQSQLTTAGLRGIEFPWAQLTQLTIQISSSIEALALLRNCSSLQVCRLSPTPLHGRREVSRTLPKPKAVLPRLRTLVVEDGFFFEGLLRCLVAPTLDALEFIQRGSSAILLESILLLIKNSSAKLTSLDLRHQVKCSPQDLADLSALVPTVAGLNLEEPCEESLQRLTIGPHSFHDVLFPHLRQLYIINPTASRFVLFNMFCSRLYLAPNLNIITNIFRLQHAQLYLPSVGHCDIPAYFDKELYGDSAKPRAADLSFSLFTGPSDRGMDFGFKLYSRTKQ